MKSMTATKWIFCTIGMLHSGEIWCCQHIILYMGSCNTYCYTTSFKSIVYTPLCVCMFSSTIRSCNVVVYMLPTFGLHNLCRLGNSCEHISLGARNFVCFLVTAIQITHFVNQLLHVTPFPTHVFTVYWELTHFFFLCVYSFF